MFDHIFTHIKFGKHYCGIEHTEANIFAAILKKTTKEVTIERTLTTNSIENLSRKLDKNKQAFLILNDNNIIIRKVESNQTDIKSIVSKAYPNLNLPDFYYEIASQENHHFVAICRKEIIDNLISQYKAHNVTIYGFSLGVLKLSEIVEFLPSGKVQLNKNVIELHDSALISADQIKNSPPQEYNVNGLSVSSQYLLPFAGSMDLILKNSISDSNFETENKNLFNEFLQRRFFKIFFASGLVFLLGVLLINFFIFNHYYGNVAGLEQTSQINNVAKNNLLELNENIVKKQKMVDDMLSSNSSKSSYYASNIIQRLPNTISLNVFNYQPLKKRVKANQSILLDDQTILISGNSVNSNQFSKWLAAIESESWVDKIDIIEYGDISKTSSEFTIRLAINDQ